MANWDAQANENFRAIKADTNSTDADMEQLRARIGQWADQNPDGRTFFDFGRLRNHGVSVVKEGGWIRSLSYGDRL